MTTLSISAPNSLLVLADPSASVVPDIEDAPVFVSEDTIVIRTRMWQDGPTSVEILTGVQPSHRPDLHEVFRGTVPTPSGVLELQDILQEPFARIAIEGRTADIRVCVDDDVEPEAVSIFISNGRILTAR